jgi:anti-sigma factor RsiW
MNDQESCPRIEALSAMIDGELDVPERAALESHLAGCAICSPVFAGMRRLHDGFAALPTPRRDFDVAAEVGRRIAALAPRQPPRPAPPSRRRWWQVAALAPGGALAIAAGLWLGGSMLPAAAGPAAAQMAAFSAMPPGALCIASGSCARRLP